MDDKLTQQMPQGVDSIRLEELESELRAEIDKELSDIDYLYAERDKIGSPDNLGETIKNVVWDQFINQIGIMAGEDFVKENRGLKFDPRVKSHRQTTEDFAKGKIAKHNTVIDYQKRYDDWQKNFQFDANGNIITKYDRRSGKEQTVLTRSAREPFDKGRSKGSDTVHMDHTVPAAEIIRDPEMNAHVSKEKQIAYANSTTNLNPLDAEANMSKGDSTVKDWLASERDGKTPDERFNINKEKIEKIDKESRALKKEITEEGKKESLDAAKQSSAEEVKRMGGQALRAALMALLADLVRKIIQKLIKWFKSAERTISSLIESIKGAVKAFIRDLKKSLLTSFDIAITAIVEAIIGPIAGIIRSAAQMMKQGWSSLKEAFEYLKNPDNKGKPIDILLMEVGQIVIAGATAAGAIALSELITKGLSTIPVFAFNIPLIGSLASIIGIFMGAVTAGILGAIALNRIDQALAEARLRENTIQVIAHGNVVLEKQKALIATSAISVARQKANSEKNIIDRHSALRETVSDGTDDITDSQISETKQIQRDNDNLISDITDLLNS